jgi:putative methionine-R-sulfoxide reductase with GAF domain
MANSILNIGVREENVEYLNEKIRATNFICLFCGILSLPFIAITYYFIPGLTYLPIAFFASSLLGVFFNYISFSGLARFIGSFVFVALYAVFSAYITPDNGALLASLTALHVLFLLPPWILFDLQEKRILFGYSLFSSLTILLMPILNNWFTYQAAVEVIELFTQGWLFYLCLGSAVISMSGALLFLEYSTFNTGKKNDQLINEMNEKASQIKLNEKKLNDYIKEIEAAKKDSERRQWSSQGLAMFADLLRAHHGDSQKMFDNILSNLVKYIGANQGALFLIEGENENRSLQQVATYAYDRKKYIQKTVPVGEGVLGQAVLEKSPVYMTAVPTQYIQITSGLGDAPPRSLLVSPLIVNEEVFGVIELASFQKIESHVQEFVGRIGESIASTISTVRVSEKTKTLLEELQQQTEEMKSQEEEMRQNMEELVATQEEMQRKEQEYLQRIAELEQGHLTQSYN